MVHLSNLAQGSGLLWEISAEQWQDTLDTNLTGLWHTINAAVPPMIEAGNGGSIITISSAAGIKAVPGCGHCCACKFGVVGLTNSLALPTDSLAAPDLISDIVVWLAGDASSLVTAAQIPADKGYLKI